MGRIYGCELCPCFTAYQDRDLAVLPYKEVEAGKSLYRDECLYACQIDDVSPLCLHPVSSCCLAILSPANL